MAVGESDATAAIAQILDNNTAVADWEITDVTQSNGDFTIDCKIQHSRAFQKRRYRNVNSFDLIEFNELVTPDTSDGIKYTVTITKDTAPEP
jgi:hypothetical protein